MTTVTTPHTIEGAALARAIPNVTLPQLIRERARQHPDDIALIDAASGRSTRCGEVDRLIGRCAAGLAERVVDFKQLADIVPCEAIPRNPSGKILRRVLRAQDAARVAG